MKWYVYVLAMTLTVALATGANDHKEDADCNNPVDFVLQTHLSRDLDHVPVTRKPADNNALRKLVTTTTENRVASSRLLSVLMKSLYEILAQMTASGSVVEREPKLTPFNVHVNVYNTKQGGDVPEMMVLTHKIGQKKKENGKSMEKIPVDVPIVNLQTEETISETVEEDELVKESYQEVKPTAKISKTEPQNTDEVDKPEVKTTAGDTPDQGQVVTIHLRDFETLKLPSKTEENINNPVYIVEKTSDKDDVRLSKIISSLLIPGLMFEREERRSPRSSERDRTLYEGDHGEVEEQMKGYVFEKRSLKERSKRSVPSGDEQASSVDNAETRALDDITDEQIEMICKLAREIQEMTIEYYEEVKSSNETQDESNPGPGPHSALYKTENADELLNSNDAKLATMKEKKKNFLLKLKDKLKSSMKNSLILTKDIFLKVLFKFSDLVHSAKDKVVGVAKGMVDYAKAFTDAVLKKKEEWKLKHAEKKMKKMCKKIVSLKDKADKNKDEATTEKYDCEAVP